MINEGDIVNSTDVEAMMMSMAPFANVWAGPEVPDH